jgi:hypothetical protein
MILAFNAEGFIFSSQDIDSSFLPITKDDNLYSSSGEFVLNASDEQYPTSGPEIQKFVDKIATFILENYGIEEIPRYGVGNCGFINYEQLGNLGKYFEEALKIDSAGYIYKGKEEDGIKFDISLLSGRKLEVKLLCYPSQDLPYGRGEIQITSSWETNTGEKKEISISTPIVDPDIRWPLSPDEGLPVVPSDQLPDISEVSDENSGIFRIFSYLLDLIFKDTIFVDVEDGNNSESHIFSHGKLEEEQEQEANPVLTKQLNEEDSEQLVSFILKKFLDLSGAPYISDTDGDVDWKSMGELGKFMQEAFINISGEAKASFNIEDESLTLEFPKGEKIILSGESYLEPGLLNLSAITPISENEYKTVRFYFVNRKGIYMETKIFNTKIGEITEYNRQYFGWT